MRYLYLLATVLLTACGTGIGTSVPNCNRDIFTAVFWTVIVTATFVGFSSFGIGVAHQIVSVHRRRQELDAREARQEQRRVLLDKRERELDQRECGLVERKRELDRREKNLNSAGS